jgi:hypothetical protein
MLHESQHLLLFNLVHFGGVDGPPRMSAKGCASRTRRYSLDTASTQCFHSKLTACTARRAGEGDEGGYGDYQRATRRSGPRSRPRGDSRLGRSVPPA